MFKKEIVEIAKKARQEKTNRAPEVDPIKSPYLTQVEEAIRISAARGEMKLLIATSPWAPLDSDYASIKSIARGGVLGNILPSPVAQHIQQELEKSGFTVSNLEKQAEAGGPGKGLYQRQELWVSWGDE